MRAERLYRRFTRKKFWFLLSLLLLLFLLSLLALSVGAASLSPAEVWRAFLSRILPLSPPDRLSQVIVWELRVPRVLLALFAGAGLALAGAVSQALLRNPLASPYTLGVSSAAGFGASLGLVLGLGVLGGEYLVVVNAFCFALLSTLLVWGLSVRKGMSSESIILAGIAVMYLFSSLTSILQYVAEPRALQGVIFWLMGGLHTATWERLLPVLLILLLCSPLLLRYSWDLNALAMGDETAMGLGVNVKWVRGVGLVLFSLLTAGIVSFTGTIGFIGLVSPHFARMLVGGDHRFVLPCSCLVGALLLLAADTLARTLIAPTEIPVGAVTALLGIPFFLHLLMRKRREFWS
ncbi:MAG: iron ABC transporter permease [Candidatus Hadarchaeales archaeon]